MKKILMMSLGDMTLIEIADVLIGFWIVALLLTYKPTQAAEFFVDWTWAFFALAIIVGIRPAWKALYGEKSAKGKAVVTKKVMKKKRAKKK